MHRVLTLFKRSSRSLLNLWLIPLAKLNELIVPRRRDSDQTFAAQMASFQFMGESNGVVFDEYMLGPYRNSLKGKPTFLITAKPNGPATIPQIPASLLLPPL